MTYSVHTDCSRPQRVKNRFNNHSGPRNPKNRAHPYSRSICTTIRALLAGDNTNINRPKQKLQPTQAYSALYWQKKLKAIIDNEWADKVVSEPELKKKSGAYLRYMNMRLGQMLKDEDDGGEGGGRNIIATTETCARPSFPLCSCRTKKIFRRMNANVSRRQGNASGMFLVIVPCVFTNDRSSAIGQSDANARGSSENH